jgi:hypothetical protein
VVKEKDFITEKKWFEWRIGCPDLHEFLSVGEFTKAPHIC